MSGRLKDVNLSVVRGLDERAVVLIALKDSRDRNNRNAVWVNVVLPPDEARALGRELVRYAEEAMEVG